MRAGKQGAGLTKGARCVLEHEKPRVWTTARTLERRNVGRRWWLNSSAEVTIMNLRCRGSNFLEADLPSQRPAVGAGFCGALVRGERNAHRVTPRTPSQFSNRHFLKLSSRSNPRSLSDATRRWVCWPLRLVIWRPLRQPLDEP